MRLVFGCIFMDFMKRYEIDTNLLKGLYIL